MKRVLFTVLMALVLLLSLSGTVAAAPPADNPGNGPPAFDKIVFVHYPKGEEPARLPAKPAPTEGEYKLTKYHWADTSIPVTYLVNLGGMPEGFETGIDAAFQTWEDDPLSYMDFTDGETTTIGISSVANKPYMDGYNVVGWANISAKYPGAIAVTIYWYNVATKHVAEVDVAMNSDSKFKWWQEPTGETWSIGDTSTAYDVDVQNIMTHEAGHWLVLGDLYATYNTGKTMYGYSDEFELKKRSLDPGDEAGIRKIYPGSTKP